MVDLQHHTTLMQVNHIDVDEEIKCEKGMDHM